LQRLANSGSICSKRGGVQMSDEQIKEITIAMIEKGFIFTGTDNEDTAKEVASFINVLKKELS